MDYESITAIGKACEEVPGRHLCTCSTAPETELAVQRVRLHHLRRASGRQEIDLVAELPGGKVVGIGIKAAAAVGLSEARHLAWLRDRLSDRFAAGVVLHTGPDTFELGDRILAAPVPVIWT